MEIVKASMARPLPGFTPGKEYKLVTHPSGTKLICDDQGYPWSWDVSLQKYFENISTECIQSGTGQHHWKEYKGFMFDYHYCIYCDKKKHHGT